MKRWLLVSTLVIFSSVGCDSSSNKGNEQKSTPPPVNSPTAVSAVTVVSRKLHTTVSLPSELIPYESVDIYPKVRLTAQELNSQRAQAEAAVLAAQSQLATAQAKLASDNGTYLHMVAAAKTPGVIAENDVMVASQTVTADKSLVEAAEQNVAAAHDALRSISQTESYLVITAPFDGVVTTRNLHPGALIGPASGQAGAQPILRIVDDRRLRLVVPVPEAQVGEVKEGQQVSFTVPAFPAKALKAPIRRISHLVDDKTRTMPIELDATNSDGKLSPGSFATVLWPVDGAYPTLFVPTSAVTTDQQHTFVIRVRDNKAEWVNVQTGQTVNGEIEVFGELKAGDLVVKNATDAIHSGDSLQAQATQTNQR